MFLDDWRDFSGPLDDTISQSLASKCINLSALTVKKMDEANDDTRLPLARLIATVLTQSTTLETVNFYHFSEYKDAGEGEVILTALKNSPCLPQIKTFRCSWNLSWFSEGKESNVELLTQALRNMTAVETINFL